MDLLISIIIPAYNIENYIAKCLDSLLNQTYKNIEIIIVDDGSSDNTGKVIDDYVSKYKNIIRGRMGIPCEVENISVISIVVVGELDSINSLTGKLGKIPSVLVKTSISKKEVE